MLSEKHLLLPITNQLVNYHESETSWLAPIGRHLAEEEEAEEVEDGFSCKATVH